MDSLFAMHIIRSYMVNRYCKSLVNLYCIIIRIMINKQIMNKGMCSCTCDCCMCYACHDWYVQRFRLIHLRIFVWIVTVNWNRHFNKKIIGSHFFQHTNDVSTTLVHLALYRKYNSNALWVTTIAAYSWVALLYNITFITLLVTKKQERKKRERREYGKLLQIKSCSKTLDRKTCLLINLSKTVAETVYVCYQELALLPVWKTLTRKYSMTQLWNITSAKVSKIQFVRPAVISLPVICWHLFPKAF